MNVSQVNEQCCGCKNCLNVCPVDAIQFEINPYGFEYPNLDSEKCIHCGLCGNACPAIVSVEKSTDVFDCGAAYASDEETRFQGSSGGLFGLFAKEVIKQGGVVFGAAFDEDLKLKTTAAQSHEELTPLYKSKYLLCDTNSSFEKIKKILDAGQTVLYTSSPCQIAALKLYLKKEYENLLTMEFICHGVGSQSLFDQSIAYYEKTKNVKIKNFEFRHKKRTTSRCFLMEYEKNGKTKKKINYYFFFPYYYAYYKQHMIHRKNCNSCTYASKNRVADLTVGDFHEIEKYNPKFRREDGCSMVLINTPKGQKWFESLRAQLVFESMDKEILYQNNRFSSRETVSAKRNEFFEALRNNGPETTFKKYLNPKKEWKKYLYYSMPVRLMKLLKKIL